MIQGPVDWLLAFWSGMHVSTCTGSLPGETFNEHLTWYNLQWNKKKDSCKHEILELLLWGVSKPAWSFIMFVGIITSHTRHDDWLIQERQTFELRMKVLPAESYRTGRHDNFHWQTFNVPPWHATREINFQFHSHRLPYNFSSPSYISGCHEEKPNEQEERKASRRTSHANAIQRQQTQKKYSPTRKTTKSMLKC